MLRTTFEFLCNILNEDAGLVFVLLFNKRMALYVLPWLLDRNWVTSLLLSFGRERRRARNLGMERKFYRRIG